MVSTGRGGSRVVQAEQAEMRRGDAELQSDAQWPRQRHPPSASLSGRGEGGGGEGGGARGKGGKGGTGGGGASCPRD